MECSSALSLVLLSSATIGPEMVSCDKIIALVGPRIHLPFLPHPHSIVSRAST